MAYTWEPRWKPIRVEYEGMVVHTCMDRITGMIACPICIDAYHTFLSGSGEGGGGGKENYVFFYTEKDLFLHIKSHYERRHAPRIMQLRVNE